MTKSSKKKPGNRRSGRWKEQRSKLTVEARRERQKARDDLPRVRTGPQCSARRTNGLPCKNPPIKGGTVCARHGGSAPQVRAKAEKRLLAAADKLMAALLDIAMDKSQPSMVRLAAIRDALNRAGFDAKGITPEKEHDPWAALLSDGTEVVDDRSLGARDPVAELEIAAQAVQQFQRDANDEAWREYDREDAEEYERGRIRPDEGTIPGERIYRQPGSGPIEYPGETDPPVGGTEMDPTPDHGRYSTRAKTREELLIERLNEQDAEDRRRGFWR